MPLSDHEQRLLEQMERALYAEDPKFATTMRGADLRRRYRRRAVAAAFVFVIGIVLLMTGAVSKTTPLGVAGFVVMLVSAWYAVTSWRRVPAEGEIGTFDAGTGGSSRRPAASSRAGPPRLAGADSWSAWKSVGGAAANAVPGAELSGVVPPVPRLAPSPGRRQHQSSPGRRRPGSLSRSSRLG